MIHYQKQQIFDENLCCCNAVVSDPCDNKSQTKIAITFFSWFPWLYLWFWTIGHHYWENNWEKNTKDIKKLHCDINFFKTDISKIVPIGDGKQEKYSSMLLKYMNFFSLAALYSTLQVFGREHILLHTWNLQSRKSTFLINVTALCKEQKSNTHANGSF